MGSAFLHLERLRALWRLDIVLNILDTARLLHMRLS